MKPTTSPTPPPTRGPSTQSHCHSLDVTGPLSSGLAPTASTSSAQSAISSHPSRVLVARGTTVNKTLGSSSSRTSNFTQPSQQFTNSSSQPPQESRTKQYKSRLPPSKAHPTPAFFAQYHEDHLARHLDHYKSLLAAPSNVSTYEVFSAPSNTSSAKLVTYKKPFLSLTYSLLRQQCL